MQDVGFKVCIGPTIADLRCQSNTNRNFHTNLTQRNVDLNTEVSLTDMYLKIVIALQESGTVLKV